MASPEEFSRRMATLGTRVAANADRVVRKVALATDQIVVMATPVDTGRARANWVAALDAAFIGTNPAPGSPGSGANQALEQCRSVVGEYDGDRNVAIHITNNLPYIRPLDDGSSKQAPRGFVLKAALTATRTVRGAKLLGPTA